MHSAIECLPCALRQCRRLVRLTGGDRALEDEVVAHVTSVAERLSLDDPPSTYTSHLLLAAMDRLGTPDPYREAKIEQNRSAAALAGEADRQLGPGDEGLRRALELAAAGNVIDSGPRHRFRIEDALGELRFAHDDSDELLERLGSPRDVMYVLDNAGEVRFDELVLKRLDGHRVTIVARSRPILNDVTLEEARELGLERYGRVIGTGSPFLGVDMATVSDEFRAAHRDAEVVIAKGHANFESLAGVGDNGFFVLKAKCELVARPLGVELGESACFHAPAG